MQSENFLLLSLAAKTFACRPSAMAGLDDPVLALDFDLASAARLLARERAALRDVRGEGDENEFPAGSRAREERW